MKVGIWNDKASLFSCEIKKPQAYLTGKLEETPLKKLNDPIGYYDKKKKKPLKT